jgi:hypothetical protein
VVISLVQTVPLTGAVVVSTPSDVALQDARKALEMFAQVNVEVLGIVENMSHFTCPHCQPGDRHLFQRRRGADGAAVQRAVPGLDRAGPGHPRRRRPRPAGGAGTTPSTAAKARPLCPSILPTTWTRFFDAYEPVHALVAELDGKLLGLVHLHLSSQHHLHCAHLLPAGPVHARVGTRRKVWAALSLRQSMRAPRKLHAAACTG